MANSTKDIPPRRKSKKPAGPMASSRPPKEPPRPKDRRPAKRRPGRSRGWIYGVAAVTAVALIVVLVVVLTSSGGHKKAAKRIDINYTLTDGTKVYGALGPEDVPLELGDALAQPNTGLTGRPVTGIQCSASEQTVYHHHVHVAIFVHGKPYSVPIGVGITPPAVVQETAKGPFAASSGATNGCFYWIHVHAQDGIVHMESPITKIFELGQFFGVWQQPLSANQIGPFTGPVTATVNGTPWTGNPSAIPMNSHDDIVLNLGTPVISPPPIVWTGTNL